jgi:hypothetical protein
MCYSVAADLSVGMDECDDDDDADDDEDDVCDLIN